MSTEGIIAALMLFAISLLIVAAPLVRGAQGGGEEALTQKRRERLLVYYERVITNIRDLDEDLATGKIAEAEYENEREIWVQRGIEVLKALDGLEGNKQTLLRSREADEAAIDREIDSAIEAAVAAFRSR